jgi:DNA polymerase-3 subunit gamma/tau
MNEMVGQYVVLSEMKERSKDINFPNQMLFVGQSGSGKSTLALILAKLINCKNPQQQEDGTYEPCNECSACTDVVHQRWSRDVYYMDATYMGKEEVQKLHEKTGSRPMYDKNKVIIIDEAHLLNSKEARGGMLTLTEKPKENVYFILCTTDISPFDTAFQSRFMTYKFYSAKLEDIGRYLIQQLESENYTDEYIKQMAKNIIPIIADNAEGSIRQAIQYMERVIYSGITTVEELEKEMGFISQTSMNYIIGYALNGDVPQFFKFYNSLSDKKFFFNILGSQISDMKKYMLGHTNVKQGAVEKAKAIVEEQDKQAFNILFDTVVTLNHSIRYSFSNRIFELHMLQALEKIQGVRRKEKNQSVSEDNNTKRRRRAAVSHD